MTEIMPPSYTDWHAAAANDILEAKVFLVRTEDIALHSLDVSESLLDEIHVSYIEQASKDGTTPFLPIILQAQKTDSGVSHRIIDGFHRISAWQRVFAKDNVMNIPSIVLYGIDEATMYDLRVVAASGVGTVAHKRRRQWIQQSFIHTPWHDDHLSELISRQVVTVHMVRDRLLHSVELNNRIVSSAHVKKLTQWLDHKRKLWGWDLRRDEFLPPKRVTEIYAQFGTMNPVYLPATSSTEPEIDDIQPPLPIDVPPIFPSDSPMAVARPSYPPRPSEILTQESWHFVYEQVPRESIEIPLDNDHHPVLPIDTKEIGYLVQQMTNDWQSIPPLELRYQLDEQGRKRHAVIASYEIAYALDRLHRLYQQEYPDTTVTIPAKVFYDIDDEILALLRLRAEGIAPVSTQFPRRVRWLQDAFVAHSWQDSQLLQAITAGEVQPYHAFALAMSNKSDVSFMLDSAGVEELRDWAQDIGRLYGRSKHSLYADMLMATLTDMSIIDQVRTEHGYNARGVCTPAMLREIVQKYPHQTEIHQQLIDYIHTHKLSFQRLTSLLKKGKKLGSIQRFKELLLLSPDEITSGETGSGTKSSSPEPSRLSLNLDGHEVNSESTNLAASGPSSALHEHSDITPLPAMIEHPTTTTSVDGHIATKPAEEWLDSMIHAITTVKDTSKKRPPSRAHKVDERIELSGTGKFKQMIPMSSSSGEVQYFDVVKGKVYDASGRVVHSLTSLESFALWSILQRIIKNVSLHAAVDDLLETLLLSYDPDELSPPRLKAIVRNLISKWTG